MRDKITIADEYSEAIHSPPITPAKTSCIFDAFSPSDLSRRNRQIDIIPTTAACEYNMVE
jgi:hypothetical protein